MNKKITGSLAVILSLAASNAFSDQNTNNKEESTFYATLPTVSVEAMEEDDKTKGYVNYEEASLSRNNATIKEIPQTIDTLNIQKNKNYGTNDLSSILEGHAGIDATADVRSDNIYIRGFRADVNDIYRDGIRESGQVRRSTANIERVEILKGPASLLFGRSTGGGVINLVSKSANFDSTNNAGLLIGSNKNKGANLDINQALNDNVAIRFVGDITDGSTSRKGLQTEIDNESKMFSPSITVTDNDKIIWTTQYTYDYAKRTADRGPTKDVYDQMGISYDTAFAHDGDYVEDEMQILRSTLNVAISPNWEFNWDLGYREAAQNFDNYYSGSFDSDTKLLTQNYSWQETENTTLSNNLTLNGEFKLANITNKVTLGADYSKEERTPTLSYTRGNTFTFDPYNSSTWTDDATNEITSDYEHQIISKGIFFNNVMELTNKLNLVTGLRYDTYKLDSKNVFDGDSYGDTNSYSGDSISPQIGLVYDINEDHTVYGSYNKSFVPQGTTSYLSLSTSKDGDELNEDPQENEQFEIGLKSDWLNGRLSSTLSFFHIEHSNIKYQPDETDPTLWAIRGKERSIGSELSLIGQAYKDIYFRGSLGIKKATVIEDKNHPEYEGNYLSNTSKFTGNVFVRYAPSAQNYYTEVGVTHIGKRHYYSYSRGTKSTLDAFNRVDALVGYKYKDVNVTLGISNLLDKEYWRSSSIPGDSRSATLRLNYKF